MASKSKNLKFDINKIERDKDLQARVKINQQTVASYAKEMKEGVVFDPIILFQEGEGDKACYWLADGWHRVGAYEQNKTKLIPAEVYEGTKRDALLYAVNANAKHGLRRSTADKQRGIDILLFDDEWRQWSDQELAKYAGVDAKTVGTRRKKHEKDGTIPPVPDRKSNRNGKPTTTKTSKIGNKKKPEKTASAVKPDAAKDTPPSVKQAGSNGHVEPQITSTEDGSAQAQSDTQGVALAKVSPVLRGVLKSIILDLTGAVETYRENAPQVEPSDEQVLQVCEKAVQELRALLGLQPVMVS